MFLHVGIEGIELGCRQKAACRRHFTNFSVEVLLYEEGTNLIHEFTEKLSENLFLGINTIAFYYEEPLFFPNWLNFEKC